MKKIIYVIIIVCFLMPLSYAIPYSVFTNINATGNITVNNINFTGTIYTPKNFSIGYNAANIGTDTIAFGKDVLANQSYALAIGTQTVANQVATIAIGSSEIANGTSAIAIGSNTISTGANSISLGVNVNSTTQQTIAIGFNVKASGASAIAIGTSAIGNVSSIAIGSGSVSSGSQALAIGNNALANGVGGTAVGNTAIANGTNALAVGYTSYALNTGIALGYSATANGTSFPIAIGTNSVSTNSYAIALGYKVNTTADNQLMVGSVAQNLNTQIMGILNTSGNLYENNVRVITVVPYQNNSAGWVNTSVLTATLINASVGGNLNITGSLNVATTNLTCTQISGCVNNAITTVQYQNNSAGWANNTVQTATTLNVSITGILNVTGKVNISSYDNIIKGLNSTTIQCDYTTQKSMYNITTGKFECATDQTSAGSGYTTIVDETTTLTQRATLNFTGAGISCVDVPGTTSTTCTIAGGAGSPVGSNGSIQFNNNSVFAGSTYVTIKDSGYLSIEEGLEPAISTSREMLLYDIQRANESLLGMKGTAGYGKFVQPSFAYDDILLITPSHSTGTVAPVVVGGGPALVAVVGTINNPVLTGASIRNTMTWSTVVTAASTNYSLTEQKLLGLHWMRGNDSLKEMNGGFKANMRFNQPANNPPGSYWGIGMTGSATAMTNISNFFNGALFANNLFYGYNTTQTTLGIWSANSTGVTRQVDCGVNYPIGNNSNATEAVYEGTIFAKPASGGQTSTTISFYLKRLDNESITPCTAEISTYIPAQGVPMTWRMFGSNGGNSVATTAIWGFNRIYLSKDK